MQIISLGVGRSMSKKKKDYTLAAFTFLVMLEFLAGVLIGYAIWGYGR